MLLYFCIELNIYIVVKWHQITFAICHRNAIGKWIDAILKSNHHFEDIITYKKKSDTIYLLYIERHFVCCLTQRKSLCIWNPFSRKPPAMHRSSAGIHRNFGAPHRSRQWSCSAIPSTDCWPVGRWLWLVRSSCAVGWLPWSRTLSTLVAREIYAFGDVAGRILCSNGRW